MSLSLCVCVFWPLFNCALTVPSRAKDDDDDVDDKEDNSRKASEPFLVGCLTTISPEEKPNSAFDGHPRSLAPGTKRPASLRPRSNGTSNGKAFPTQKQSGK